MHAEAEGIQAENPRLDYPKVKDRKDGIVNKHSKGVEILLKRAKVERISGYATLKGGGKVEVKSDRRRRRSKPRTSSSPPARRRA